MAITQWLDQYGTQVMSGTLTTLALTSLALVLGFAGALIMALLKLYAHHTWRWLIDGYIFFMRGTPILVQFFLVYFGIGQMTGLQGTALWLLISEPFACAVIVLALNSAAYTTVMLYGAMICVPIGEIESAKALGMPTRLYWRRIIFPRAFAQMLPAYSNEVVLVLKASSLASTITLLDLMGVIRSIVSQTYDPLTGLTVAGVIYLTLTGIIVGGFKWIETRYQRWE
ncbi:MAG: ABC transporter permease subunit [Legionellales bacterium]|nr:ABC transporter permease subunit [Legionellales bacterium]